MARNDEKLIQISPEQFKQLQETMTEAAAAATTKATYAAVALVLDHYAAALDAMRITTHSEAARQGAEYALAEAGAIARRIAAEMREKASDK